VGRIATQVHDREADNLLVASGEVVVALACGQCACMRLNADGDLYANHGEFIPYDSYTVAGDVLDRAP
jgi:hypothetical protein